MPLYTEEYDDDILNLYNEIEFDTLNGLNCALAKSNCAILHINIRSLNANLSLLESFINDLKSKPQIIVCSEVWTLNCPYLYNIDNYYLYYNESKINIADGVVIYIRKDINHNVSIVKYGRSTILNCSIRLADECKILVSGMYRCHDIAETDFIDSIRLLMSKTDRKKFKHHFIVGDYNMNLLKPNRILDEFLDTAISYGYVPLFKTVTRPNEYGGTCIDNIFVRTTLDITPLKYSQILPDHYPILCSFNIENQIKKEKFYTKLKYHKLLHLCNKNNWDKYNTIADPDAAIDALVDDVKTLVDAATVKVKICNKYRKKWMTRGLSVSIEHKELLYIIWKRNKNSAAAKQNYLSYNKILNKVLKKAKELSEVNSALSSCHSQKKLWSFINNKLGKEKKRVSIEKIIVNNSEVINNNTQIAKVFNDFYVNIGKELASQIDLTSINTASFNYHKPPILPNTFFLHPTDVTEMSSTINALKDKGGGIDNIHSRVLRLLTSFISPVLVEIYNNCVSSGIWPKALKKAEIVPIYKAGDKTQLTNYRPISLISNIAKIFERLLYNRLYKFFIKFRILHKKQFGFRQNVGTTDAQFDITNLVYESIDKNLAVLAVYIDLSKAFDTVNHKLLLDKLFRYGVRGLSLKLIQSYLTERKQCVRIDNQCSPLSKVEMGVPQGSVLGPLLFIIYMNDIFDMSKIVIAFADDTVFLSIEDSWSKAEQQMNLSLNNINIWFSLNGLTLNVTKTQYMTFGCYADSVPSSMNIHINNTVLARVESCKYLGIIMDYNMKWDKHVQKVINKLRYYLLIFYKLKHLPNIILRTFYFANVYSLLNYGLIVWGGAYPTVLGPLKSLLKKFSKLLNQNDLLNFEQLYVSKCLLYHYDRLKCNFTESTSITRYKQLELPNYKKRLSNKNSTYIATKFFNRLPNDLKSLRGSKKFIKNKIEKHVRQMDVNDLYN